MTIATAFNATEISITPLDSDRLRNAKVAHVTRRLNLGKRGRFLLSGDIRPNPGDVVLARVVDINHHKRIELVGGRKSILFPGDEVVVCYGARYAPDQFGAEVPDDLGGCALVAAGGLAARVVTQHKRISSATTLCPIGMIAETPERAVNVLDAALPHSDWPKSRPATLAVFGTTMNSGKTASAAHLIKGLARAGLNVGAAKVTGTAAGNDTWLMHDAGASIVLDFTDAGFCSTFRISLPDLERVATTLVHQLARTDVDVIVLEVADGLHQVETRALLRSERFRGLADGVLFAAQDACGATSGASALRELGHNLCAVTGAIGAAPLAIQEAREETGEYVIDILDLADREVALQLLGSAGRERQTARAV